MLISIPQLILPVLLYWLGSKYGNANIGLAIVAAVGILGLALKEKLFSNRKIYKSEICDHSSLQAKG
jgi:hypothetical protein